MSTILSKSGVTSGMEFVCSDCGEITTGQEVIDGAYVYIVRKNLDDLHRSIWRCANCQDDVDDYLRD
jgi:predicted RNA-binding Zn-ribbon protein involved in translation (DUF1610 family)